MISFIHTLILSGIFEGEFVKNAYKENKCCDGACHLELTSRFPSPLIHRWYTLELDGGGITEDTVYTIHFDAGAQVLKTAAYRLIDGNYTILNTGEGPFYDKFDTALRTPYEIISSHKFTTVIDTGGYIAPDYKLGKYESVFSTYEASPDYTTLSVVSEYRGGSEEEYNTYKAILEPQGWTFADGVLYGAAQEFTFQKRDVITSPHAS